MRTKDLRCAAYLMTVGHQVRGLELDHAGYGVVVFDDKASSDVGAYERGAQAPAEKLIANYRRLVRQVDEVRKLGVAR